MSHSRKDDWEDEPPRLNDWRNSDDDKCDDCGLLLVDCVCDDDDWEDDDEMDDDEWETEYDADWDE